MKIFYIHSLTPWFSLGNVWRCFCLSQNGWGVLLACPRWGPGILLNILGCTRQPLTTKGYLTQNVSKFEIKKFVFNLKEISFLVNFPFGSSILQEVNWVYKFQRAGLTSLMISNYIYSFNHILIQYFLALIGIKITS